MALDTQKYVRKPLIVEAVRVTEDNFLELAFWCKGSIKPNQGKNPKPGERIDIDPPNQHICMDVKNPLKSRQTRAYVGDWVLFANGDRENVKIYTDKAFRASFDLESGAQLDMPVDKVADEIIIDVDNNGVEKKASPAVCNVCEAPKAIHSIGEACNNNCGGTVIAA